MPRPAGRSGCVNTSGTGKPASWMAASAAAANSGVPAKMTRNEWLMYRGGSRNERALHRVCELLHLALDASLLERRQVLDEYAPHQVIHLVLDTHREQTFAVQLVGLALLIERAHAHFLGTFDVVVDAGYRQATFFVDLLLVARPDDLGIDEHMQFVVRVRYVDHDNALVYVHLSGRKPDAGCRVHCLGHICDQSADAFIDRFDWFGDLVQALVRVIDDVQ